MSTDNPRASAPVIGKPDLTVRFSREFLSGLFAELQAIDPLGQQPRTEPTGLLFGFVDDTSVRLEKFEPLHLDKSNETDSLDREAAEEEVLEKSVFAARLRHSPDPAVTGWYRVRAVEHPRLLDRDVGVHNRCFKSDRDVILIVRPEPTGRLTLEFYAAKPHSLLATHEHRRGLLQVASVNNFADGFEVSLSLTGTVNNELLFLSVFEASRRAERQEKWENVRTYMPRFTGFVRTAVWFLATIIVSVLIYSTARLYLKPLLPHFASEASAGVHHGQQLSSQTALALKVSQNGSALELQWRPDSAAIQNATGGTLNINDGAITRQIDLDQAQVRSGRIVYTPVSDDVTFDLKVMDSASHSIADSIRVLGSASGAASIGSLVERRSAAPLRDRSRKLSQSATASPLGGVAKKESLIGRAPSGNQVSAAAQESSGGQALKDKSILEAEDWNRVKDSHNIADLEDFLRQYPSGPHAREAKEAAGRIKVDLHAPPAARRAASNERGETKVSGSRWPSPSITARSTRLI
jgi:hypothetical protein